MRKSLNKFTDDKLFIFAIAQDAKREANLKRKEKHDRKMRVFIPILAAVIATVLTFCFANLNNIITALCR